MATVADDVVGLADLTVGRSGVCYAVLVKHEEKISSRQEPYLACVFRARHVMRTAKVWANNQCINDVRACVVGEPYRLTAVGEAAYGSDLKILRIEPAGGPEHEAEGFRISELIPSTEFDVKDLCDGIWSTIDGFADPHIRELMRSLLRAHGDLFKRMPAAEGFHHAYRNGLLEHVWSLTRICGFLADHYGAYYRKLEPPLNKDLLLAAAIVHDIGKLQELTDDPFNPTYTTRGRLIGHITIGRDMVREAAAKIEGFPEDTLLRLEHAILAHHGKKEWGSPVVPQTLEALVIHFADDLDSKMNAAALALLDTREGSEFSERVRPLDGRTLYRGAPPDGTPARIFGLDGSARVD
jgi:3'-5' exoribonuclease